MGDALKEQRAASLEEQSAREFRCEISCDCNSLHYACPFCMFDHSSRRNIKTCSRTTKLSWTNCSIIDP